MLGVDPTKADDDFKITRFWMEDGVPKFEFATQRTAQAIRLRRASRRRAAAKG
jgi:hypothetical protein